MALFPWMLMISCTNDYHSRVWKLLWKSLDSFTASMKIFESLEDDSESSSPKCSTSLASAPMKEKSYFWLWSMYLYYWYFSLP